MGVQRACNPPSMCAKRLFASSAALAASRGRRNTLGTLSMAAMDRISFEHLRAHAHNPSPAGPRQRPGQPNCVLPSLQLARYVVSQAPLLSTQPLICIW